MDLKQLHTFVTLSKIKNFTKTANELHYAQSNVTTQIQQLEEEFGVPLFERLGRSVSLTAKGQELLPYATQMLHLAHDAKKALQEADHGHLSIAAFESLCTYRLPRILKEYRTRYPEVELRLQILDSTDDLSCLTTNEIDVAYALDPPVHLPSIQMIQKREETIGAFVLPSHPFAAKETILPTDFEGAALIVTGKACNYRKQFEAKLSSYGVKPKIMLETSSLQVIKETTLSGLGICILPVMAVEREIEQKQLVQLPYDTGCHIVSQLLYHKDKWISPELQAFLTLVQECTN